MPQLYCINMNDVGSFRCPLCDPYRKDRANAALLAIAKSESRRLKFISYTKFFTPQKEQFTTKAEHTCQFSSAGVYADLDFRALKPMDELFGKSEHLALAGRISDQDEDDTWENNVPNAWMASALPGHPLWLNCLIQVMKQAAVLNCQGPSCFM